MEKRKTFMYTIICCFSQNSRFKNETDMYFPIFPVHQPYNTHRSIHVTKKNCRRSWLRNLWLEKTLHLKISQRNGGRGLLNINKKVENQSLIFIRLQKSLWNVYVGKGWHLIICCLLSNILHFSSVIFEYLLFLKCHLEERLSLCSRTGQKHEHDLAIKPATAVWVCFWVFGDASRSRWTSKHSATSSGVHYGKSSNDAGV